MTDEYWIVRDDCGIKTFPRAGSTTILHTYGYGQSYERWLKAPRQFIVVRNPWERLLSAYNLFSGKSIEQKFKVTSVDDCIDYILSRDQEKCDIHFRSQWAQLGGYGPSPDILYDMKYFLANPPLKVSHYKRFLWENRTGRRADEIFTISKYEEWKKLYSNDFVMWDRAKKAPKEGANKPDGS